MLYLYAIAADLAGIADMRGVRDEPLVTLPFQDGLVIAGEMAAPPALDVAALAAQDAVVRALHARAAALLPMRFGMAIASAAALGPALDARVLARLARVRGCEQMVARVLGPKAADADMAPAPVAAGGSSGAGRRYLEARAKAHRGSPALAAIAAAAAARDVRTEPSAQEGVHGSVYHLIERGGAADYRAAVARAAARLPEVRVIVTGPSPAYAFA